MPKKKAAPPASPIARPERLDFHPGKQRAAEKKQAAENKREEAERLLRNAKVEHHFTDADIQELGARHTGEIPNRESRAAMVGDERHERIFGRKPLPGKPGGDKSGCHLNGRPLAVWEVELIGYANTDEGKQDPELLAKREALMREAGGRVKLVADEWDQKIMARADALNRFDVEKDSGRNVQDLEDALMRDLSENNPREKAEHLYLREDQAAKWFGANEEISGGYELVHDAKGRVVKVRDAVLAAMPRAVVERVTERITKERLERARKTRGILPEERSKDAQYVKQGDPGWRKPRDTPRNQRLASIVEATEYTSQDDAIEAE